MPRDTLPAGERRSMTITVPALLHERIRAYRTARHFESEEQAIQDLIERGLEADASEPGATELGFAATQDRE